MEYLLMKMEEDLKVNGLMENNMGKEPLYWQMVKKRKGYGMMEKEYSGLMKIIDYIDFVNHSLYFLYLFYKQFYYMKNKKIYVV